MLVHVARELSSQLAVPSSHSLISSHELMPSPVKPGEQAQLKLPSLLVQSACSWQLCGCVVSVASSVRIFY